MDNLSKCPKCGKPTMSAFNFCPFCGASLTENQPTTNSNERESNVIEDVVLEEAPTQKAETAQPNTDTVFEEFRNPSPSPSPNPSNTSSKKANKLAGNKRAMTIVKYSLVVAFCLLSFIFSFCPIYSFDLADYITPYYDVSVDGEFKINILPTDYMTGMISAAKNYDPDRDATKIEKLQEEVNDAEEDFVAELESDVNSVTGKLKPSKDTIDALNKVKTATYKSQYCTKGNAAQKVSVILCGILSLLNILFSATMLGLSVYTLACKIQDKKCKAEKFVVFLPLYLFLSLAVLSVESTVASAFISGTMITHIIFTCIAIVALLVSTCLKYKKANQIRAIVTTVAGVVLSVVVVACCLAPSMSVTFTTTLADRSKPRDYTYELGNEYMGAFLLDKYDVEQLNESFDKKPSSYIYDSYLGDVNNSLEVVKRFPTKTFVSGDIPLIYSLGLSTIKSATLVNINYYKASSLSAGYILIPIIILLVGFVVCMHLSGKFYKWSLWTTALVILFLILSLVCSIVISESVNTAMIDNDLDDAFSVELGGGLISALILSIVAFIFIAIPLPTSDDKQYLPDTYAH